MHNRNKLNISNVTVVGTYMGREITDNVLETYGKLTPITFRHQDSLNTELVQREIRQSNRVTYLFSSETINVQTINSLSKDGVKFVVVTRVDGKITSRAYNLGNNIGSINDLRTYFRTTKEVSAGTR